MKRHFFYSLVVLVFACKDKVGTDAIVKGDPLSVAGTDSTGPEEWMDLYVPRCSITLKNFAIDLKTHFELPAVLKYDSSYYYDTHLFIVRDLKRKVADTLRLGLDGYDEYGFRVEDMTDSLKYESLVLQLKWTGSSDMRCSEFVEWNGDSLKSLFYIEDLYELARRDKNTLSGFVVSRDEVVKDFQNDYPFTISLADYEVVYIKPEKQYIGFDSEVLEDIQAYRLNSKQDTVPVPLKKGTHIRIDSIFRTTKTVRLLIRDAEPAYIGMEKLEGQKITSNDAG